MRLITPLLAGLALALPLAAQDMPPTGAPSPAEIVAAAPAADWSAIAADDLLVMTLDADRDGKPRQVVIQLMPPPFSQGWTGNIRTLAAAHWWDGLAITRVQDNYVVQWGDPDAEDAAKAKPLPAGLATMRETDYTVSPDAAQLAQMLGGLAGTAAAAALGAEDGAYRTAAAQADVRRKLNPDPYAAANLHWQGWPISLDQKTGTAAPVHCYGMVGVGRNYSPDTGSGAELYAVIGHAPRHLDRNIALVGRVIEGMEHLSSLPRGTGPLGFYENAEERVPIQSIRLASELPRDERPGFQYLSTESSSFARYAEARANRRDPFFIVPAGGADICNIPVPVRRIGRVEP